MALKRKAGTKYDPIVWARPRPGVPGLSEMPAHQAKEGALLMLEAGAQPFPGLLRLAGSFSSFTMDDALDLSAKDTVRAEAVAAEHERQRRVAVGTLKVIEPQAKFDPAADEVAARRANERAKQRERIALSRFPIKHKDGLAADLLVAFLEHGGQAQVSSSFYDNAGFEEVSVASRTKMARRLAELGALTRISSGRAQQASTWELTELGRQNALAIKNLKEDGHAGKA